jgi:hypothetical protein
MARETSAKIERDVCLRYLQQGRETSLHGTRQVRHQTTLLYNIYTKRKNRLRIRNQDAFPSTQKESNRQKGRRAILYLQIHTRRDNNAQGCEETPPRKMDERRPENWKNRTENMVPILREAEKEKTLYLVERGTEKHVKKAVQRRMIADVQ